MFPIIITLAITLSAIVWTLVFIPFRFLGFKLYKIKDRSNIITLSKKVLNYAIMIEDKDKPAGFFFGFTFAGYVHQTLSPRGDSSNEIYLLSTPKKFDELITNEDNKDHKIVNLDIPETIIDLYYRSGNFFHIEYKKRIIQFDDVEATPKQNYIINEIIRLYNQSRTHNVVSYIYGVPGVGKSMIPMILCKKLKGSLCKTFKPHQAGDTLDTLHSLVSPTFKTPLILVLEEADGIITKIHNSVADHKHIPIQIQDKSSWNTFFDDLKYLYPNMIIIMTSNISLEVINSLDSCYLREGRVDCKFELSNKLDEYETNF